jgi:hypothetical protein
MGCPLLSHPYVDNYAAMITTHTADTMDTSWSRF